MEIEVPCFAAPMAPVPTSFAPCCVHTPPVRVYTHAAPVLKLSSTPPTIAVLPSAEIETDRPCAAAPIDPTSRRHNDMRIADQRAG